MPSYNYTALPDRIQYEVSWRMDWSKPMRFMGLDEEGKQVFATNSTNWKRVTYAPDEGITNPRDPRRARHPRFTGKAIAFNSEVVMVLGAYGRIYLIDPACLIRSEP